MGLILLDENGCAVAMPRERGLTEGFETLGDAELVAVLLGTGERGRTAVQVAADLLAQSAGLLGLADLGPHELSRERGVGPAKAARVGAALELGKRVAARSAAAARTVVASATVVAEWAQPRLANLDHEQVWVLALDGRRGLRAATRIAEGGLHGCSLSPRDVLRAALRAAASGFVLVHNHPSGDPKPSDADADLTARVAHAARALGTPLVDHVIIAGQQHISLFNLGLIPPWDPEGL